MNEIFTCLIEPVDYRQVDWQPVIDYCAYSRAEHLGFSPKASVIERTTLVYDSSDSCPRDTGLSDEPGQAAKKQGDYQDECWRTDQQMCSTVPTSVQLIRRNTVVVAGPKDQPKRGHRPRDHAPDHECVSRTVQHKHTVSCCLTRLTRSRRTTSQITRGVLPPATSPSELSCSQEMLEPGTRLQHPRPSSVGRAPYTSPNRKGERAMTRSPGSGPVGGTITGAFQAGLASGCDSSGNCRGQSKRSSTSLG
jgi:hypothetical protein